MDDDDVDDFFPPGTADSVVVVVVAVPPVLDFPDNHVGEDVVDRWLDTGDGDEDQVVG
jgi:hypothetical protein